MKFIFKDDLLKYSKILSIKKINQKGQVLVEYMLLLLISVSLATLLVTKLISRKEGSSGIIINSWNKMLKTLGNDLPDCPKQTNFSSAKCK